MKTYPEQVRKEAQAAADYIKKHGWCQGAYRDGKKCCALGANRMANRAHDNSPLIVAACEVLNIDSYSLHKWNDAEGRTKQEVIDLYESIANSDERKKP
jgi:hypothetical protein